MSDRVSGGFTKRVTHSEVTSNAGGRTKGESVGGLYLVRRRKVLGFLRKNIAFKRFPSATW